MNKLFSFLMVGAAFTALQVATAEANEMECVNAGTPNQVADCWKAKAQSGSMKHGQNQHDVTKRCSYFSNFTVRNFVDHQYGFLEFLYNKIILVIENDGHVTGCFILFKAGFQNHFDIIWKGVKGTCKLQLCYL